MEMVKLFLAVFGGTVAARLIIYAIGRRRQ